MSGLKTSAFLAVATVWAFCSSVLSQVPPPVNIQLPEILGALAGDKIGLGGLDNLTRDAYFSNNSNDCTGKFDNTAVGTISIKTLDPGLENATQVLPSYAIAELASVEGSHRYTISCTNKNNNSKYELFGRVEITKPTATFLYGLQGMSLMVDTTYQNDSRNMVKALGYFPLTMGDSNFRRISSDAGDAYFKNALVGPISLSQFYESDGKTLLTSFPFVGIQQGCMMSISFPFFKAEDCVIVMKDNKNAVFFNYTSTEGMLGSKIIKTKERPVQTDDNYNFEACFTVPKFLGGGFDSDIFCWFFNPATKKTKIVHTKEKDKVPDVEVNFRIIEQQPVDLGNSIICFLIDELQSKPFKVGCLTPGFGLTNLSVFNELLAASASTLNVTTNSNSNCLLNVGSLSGSTNPFRHFTGFGECNATSNKFSGYITVDKSIPQSGTGVFNMSAPLKGEVVRVANPSATAYLCKFETNIVYLATNNGNAEVNFQGTSWHNRGRLLRMPLNLVGAATLISATCSKSYGVVIVEKNNARYVLAFSSPRDFASSLLSRVPIFEKLENNGNYFDGTDDVMAGFIFNKKAVGSTYLFSDVSVISTYGYLLDIFNPQVTAAGEYKTRVTQKAEGGDSFSFDVSMSLFNGSAQIVERPGMEIPTIPRGVAHDLQKYYSLSGNFSTLTMDNNSVVTFTNLVIANSTTTNYTKGSRSVFVLGNEYLVDLDKKTFTNEKDGVSTAIASTIPNTAEFIGLVDNPPAYQMALVSNPADKTVQVVYLNTKNNKIELSTPLNINGIAINGTCFHSVNSKNEASIAVAVSNNTGSTEARYFNVRYLVDSTTGTLTKPTFEVLDHVFKYVETISRPIDKYIVQLGKDDSSGAGSFAAICPVMRFIGGNIRSAMIYPICALPEFPESGHFIVNASKTGNTVKVDVVITTGHPELGYGTAITLEADLFDGADFRPNKDIVWKVKQTRKFQKFLGHIIWYGKNGDQEVFIGRRYQPKTLMGSSENAPPAFVFSFFKTDLNSPFHQFEENNINFAAAFEYKNNWFITMLNTTGQEQEVKTVTAGYIPPTITLAASASVDQIVGQTVTFNKGTPNEVKRPMRSIAPPQPAPPAPAPAPASSSNTWIIVLVVLVGLALIGGGVYYYLFMRRETIRRESDLNANNTSRITAEH